MVRTVNNRTITHEMQNVKIPILKCFGILHNSASSFYSDLISILIRNCTPTDIRTANFTKFLKTGEPHSGLKFQSGISVLRPTQTCTDDSHGSFTTWWSVLHSSPITALDRPWGFQEVEAPRFQDNRHMKAVRLSAIRTDRLHHPANIPGTHFC